MLDAHVAQALVELFLYLSAAELRRDEEIRPSKTGLADSLPDVRFGGVFWGIIKRDLSRITMGERTLGRVDVAEAGVDRRSDIFDHTLLLPLGASAIGDCGNLSEVNEGMYVPSMWLQTYRVPVVQRHRSEGHGGLQRRRSRTETTARVPQERWEGSSGSLSLTNGAAYGRRRYR